MRATLVLAFALPLVAAPAVARADVGGCLVGPNDLSRCSVSGMPAAVLGAVAAPLIVAGAAVSIAHELSRHVEERAPNGVLALVPEATDPYRAPPGRAVETRTKPSAAFQFNDTATNVATAVTGAMVVGAVIANIVHDAHHK